MGNNFIKKGFSKAQRQTYTGIPLNEDQVKMDCDFICYEEVIIAVITSIKFWLKRLLLYYSLAT